MDHRVGYDCNCVLQGITIKPLVSLLKIGLSTEKVLSMYQEINDHVNVHLLIWVLCLNIMSELFVVMPAFVSVFMAGEGE